MRCPDVPAHAFRGAPVLMLYHPKTASLFQRCFGESPALGDSSQWSRAQRTNVGRPTCRAIV